MDGLNYEVPIDLQLDAVKVICQHYGVAQLGLFRSILRDDFGSDRSMLSLFPQQSRFSCHVPDKTLSQRIFFPKSQGWSHHNRESPDTRTSLPRHIARHLRQRQGTGAIKSMDPTYLSPQCVHVGPRW